MRKQVLKGQLSVKSKFTLLVKYDSKPVLTESLGLWPCFPHYLTLLQLFLWTTLKSKGVDCISLRTWKVYDSVEISLKKNSFKYILKKKIYNTERQKLPWINTGKSEELLEHS